MIRCARQLLTLRGRGGPRGGADLNELGIIEKGALLIRDGVIREIGSSHRVENLREARGAFEINARGKVVMPGFIDSHTHLVFPPPHSAGPDERRPLNAIRTTSADRLAIRARQHLHAMARHGTTTVEAKTGCGPDHRAETKLLRVLRALQKDSVEVVPTVLLNPPKENDSKDSAVDWYLQELLPKARQRGLASFADLAWDADPRLHDCFQRYLHAARSLGFACKIHADREHPARAMAMAAENFAVSVDHLEHATDAEAGLLSTYQTIATLLPYSSFHSHGPNAPARALIEAGVPVALGSDFHPIHAPNFNMQTVVAMACLQLRLTPAEAISAATINGAHALQCAHRAGSIELGKSADLVLLNTSDYRDIAHHFGMNLVHLTMKRGEFIYKEGDVAPRSLQDLRSAWTQL
jgi:imidazolonepropionase